MKDNKVTKKLNEVLELNITNRTEKKQSYRYREQTGVARGEGGGRRKEIGKED